MLIHPQIDPVALQLGPLAVHWYGLTYLAAFAMFYLLARQRAARAPFAGTWSPQEIEDMLFAFTIAKHVKSNAIVYARDLQTVGIGAGEG